MTKNAPSSLASQSKPMREMPQMQANTPPESGASVDTKEPDGEKISMQPDAPPQVAEDTVQLPLVTEFTTEHPNLTSVITFLFSPAAYPFLALIHLAHLTQHPDYLKLEWRNACNPSKPCWAPSELLRVSNDFFSMVYGRRNPNTAQYYEHGQVNPIVRIAFIFAVLVPLLEWRVLPYARRALLRLAETLMEDFAKMDEESRKSDKEKKRDKTIQLAVKLVKELQELDGMEDSESDDSDYSDTDSDSCGDSDFDWDSDDSDDFDDSDEEDFIDDRDLMCLGQRGKSDVEFDNALRLVMDTAKHMQGRVSTKKT